MKKNEPDREMFREFHGNPPATEFLIRKIQKEGHVTLPSDYVEFLQKMDGGEGFIGPNAYVILWRVGELLDINKAYEVSDYAPGLFLFGSDGGGEAFAFDMRLSSRPIVEVPFVGMDLNLIRPKGATFYEFLNLLANS
jgi:SMI1 / KNR4 family (SUKH-1)